MGKRSMQKATGLPQEQRIEQAKTRQKDEAKQAAQTVAATLSAMLDIIAGQFIVGKRRNR